MTFVRLSERTARVERVKMALAEAGYGDLAHVYWDYEDSSVHITRPSDSIPREVVWKAFVVAGEPDTSCWECFDANAELADDEPTPNCDHGSQLLGSATYVPGGVGG